MIWRALEIVWCMPQMVVAYLVIGYFTIRGRVEYKGEYRRAYLYAVDSKVFSGCALSKFILLPGWLMGDERVLRHEYGHYRQNLILGPLYLLVVGLPSITQNIISRFSAKFADRYFERFPENWADRLGGVKDG